MRTLACTLLILFLVACAKSESPSADSVEQASTPADCVYMSTAVHAFPAYGPLAANRYRCHLPEFSGIACDLYQTVDGKREMQCMANNSGALNDLPAQCASVVYDGNRYFYPGIRSFTSTSYLSTDTWDCKMFYGLRCFFYEHASDSTDSNVYQDLRCVDDQPYI